MSNIFSYIREKVDIVEVISHYVNLTQQGTYFKGFSPFKSEKTPSFTITPHKNIFYCFSTNQGGDVIDFVSKIENCSQYKAALLIAKKYHINLPQETTANVNQENESDRYFSLYELFVSITKKELETSPEAQYFLEKRKINSTTRKTFSLGFCPFSVPQSFINLLLKKNISLQDTVDAGLIKKKNKKVFFTAAGRLIFPIENQIGLVIGYGARTLEDAQGHMPKYLNTKQTEEFNKKKTFYGFEQAKESITKKNEIIIVEGYFDVLSMHQAGYNNTIGTMGTALSSEHVGILSKLNSTIILLYDGDSAGYNAIKKAVSLFWSHLCKVYIAALPSGEDPASILTKEDITPYLEKKISAEKFFIEESKKKLEGESFSSPGKIFGELREVLEVIEDPVKKMSLLYSFQKELAIPDAIISFLTKKENKEENISEKEKKLGEIKKKEISKTSVLFFCMTAFFCEEIEHSNMNEITKLFDLCENKEFSNLCQAYKKEQEKTFLNFLKNNHHNVYLYAIKIISTYNVTLKIYKPIKQKMLTLAWKNYKKKNISANYTNFLSYIKN